MKFQKLYSIGKGEWTKWGETVADAIDDIQRVVKHAR